MDMTMIGSCSMSSCSFNAGGMCHTQAINVGYHAECSTYHGSAKGGFNDVKGGIGACLASDCKFNDRLECTAGDIDVNAHVGHADCNTFCFRDAQDDKAELRAAVHPAR